nr:ABC transporter ATP-binding protein [Methylibium sp.]
APRSVPAAAPKPTPPKRKLGYKEQRELDALPQRIEALEAEQQALLAQLGDADFYGGPPQRVTQAQARAAQIEEELLVALERWEALASA